MNFSRSITAALIGIAISTTAAPILTVAQEVISQVLTPEQISLRAKQITVRIDGSGSGSGVIIEQSGQTYTVLTNWHVIKNPGQYTVETIDGRVHQVESQSPQQISSLDLAVLKFSTNQNYQTAEIGHSDILNEGQSIYFAGYPGELKEESDRYYRFFPTNLVGILPKPTANGYALIYDGEAFPGMSGGPVLDKNGLLVGIHGETNIHASTFGTSNYAIPIDSYESAIASQQKPQQTTVKPILNQPQPNPEVTTTKPQPSKTPTVSTSPSKPIPDVTINDVPSPNQNPREIVIDLVPQQPNSSSSTARPLSDQPQSKPDSNPGTTVPTFSSTTASNSQASIQPNQPPQQSNSNAIAPTLISSRTGIDYTPLRDLLAEKKWQDADRKTYELIEQIVKTAKNRNAHVFIELKTIADYSCTDIKTIDQLWRKYSDGKFGFTPQQKIWNNVNERGDFSTETWRSFATSVGWKQGDVASGSGYLLYEQLDFDPTEAPVGHLPWWFALPEEEQNVIKNLFIRCNFNSVAKNKPINSNQKPSREDRKKPAERN